LVNARQNAENSGNLIVNQDTNFFPLRTQDVHESKRRSDGIPIGADV